MPDQQFPRVSRTCTLEINATPQVVFPLLCPVREEDYLDAWVHEMIFSDSGVAERGCVFQTPTSDDHACTWIVTEHDPESGRLQFASVTPESHASMLDILVAAGPDEKSCVMFTYTHTAISERGRTFVKSFTAELFRKKMTVFADSLNRYVAAKGTREH